MSLTVILLLAAAVAAIMGIRIYLEEKNKAEKIEEQPIVEIKNPEQVVAERLQEIAATETVETPAIIADPIATPTVKKPKAKFVKKSAPKKKPAKIKAKQ